MFILTNPAMKRNDVVKYIGCSIEQIKWGNNDDPRSFLIIGREYVIEEVFVHSQHTKIKLYNKMGMFNSVCFELKHEGLNSSLEYFKKMDPNSITLATPSKSFAYEQQAREIENCENIEQLRNICKCYAKLYYKQQETLKCIGLRNEPDQ